MTYCHRLRIYKALLAMCNISPNSLAESSRNIYKAAAKLDALLIGLIGMVRRSLYTMPIHLSPPPTAQRDCRHGPLQSLPRSPNSSTAARPLLLSFAELLRRGVAVGPHHSFWDPGLVHAPFHPLHYQVQERLDCLAYVCPSGSASFKVGDSGRQRQLR